VLSQAGNAAVKDGLTVSAFAGFLDYGGGHSGACPLLCS
jgi:short subunit fatty acids transporter